MYIKESNPNRARLFAHPDLWQNIECGGKSKYRIIWNFCSHTFMCVKRGWHYLGVCLCMRTLTRASARARSANIV